MTHHSTLLTKVCIIIMKTLSWLISHFVSFNEIVPTGKKKNNKRKDDDDADDSIQILMSLWISVKETRFYVDLQKHLLSRPLGWQSSSFC